MPSTLRLLPEELPGALGSGFLENCPFGHVPAGTSCVLPPVPRRALRSDGHTELALSVPWADISLDPTVAATGAVSSFLTSLVLVRPESASGTARTPVRRRAPGHHAPLSFPPVSGSLRAGLASGSSAGYAPHPPPLRCAGYTDGVRFRLGGRMAVHRPKLGWVSKCLCCILSMTFTSGREFFISFL